MKFTEEEFYGNTQNVVSESGELVPINSDKEEHQNGSKIGLLALTTFLKTLIVLVCAGFYLVSVLMSLAPSLAIKVFDYVGADKASLACYERIYEKDKTLANLYNLVQKSIKNKDHQKSSKYINELQGKSDYVDFCLKVNSATIKITDKAYIAYVGDLDGYLVSQKIIAKYCSNKKEEALNTSLFDLINENKYSFGFGSYVECLEEDKSLTEPQTKAQLSALANQEYEGEMVIDLIKARKELVYASVDNSSESDKIMSVYTMLKIEKVLYKMYDALGDETLKSQSAQTIQSLQSQYNDLVK